MIDRSQTARYHLSRVKDLIVLGRVDFKGKRPKNRETMKKLGLDADAALTQIRRLKDGEFYGVDIEPGKLDADVYLKKISGMEVYIKFKIEKPNLVIISFHENETGYKP